MFGLYIAYLEPKPRDIPDRTLRTSGYLQKPGAEEKDQTGPVGVSELPEDRQPEDVSVELVAAVYVRGVNQDTTGENLHSVIFCRGGRARHGTE
mgnify:CR=1 FL=1